MVDGRVLQFPWHDCIILRKTVLSAVPNVDLRENFATNSVVTLVFCCCCCPTGVVCVIWSSMQMAKTETDRVLRSEKDQIYRGLTRSFAHLQFSPSGRTRPIVHFFTFCTIDFWTFFYFYFLFIGVLETFPQVDRCTWLFIGTR